MPLKEGTKAPEFEGKNQKGETVKLSDFKGKKLILYFYPKDLTPGCTMESCNLRDNYNYWKNNGYEIIGVSADDEKKHQRFIEKYDLPFDLIADTDKKIINDYKVWGPKKFMGKSFEGILRTTYVINEEGIIEKVFEKVKTKDHTNQIKQAYGLN